MQLIKIHTELPRQYLQDQAALGTGKILVQGITVLRGKVPHHCRAALPMIASRRGASSPGSDAAASTRDRTRSISWNYLLLITFSTYLSSHPIFAPHAFPCNLLLPSHLVERRSLFVYASQYP